MLAFDAKPKATPPKRVYVTYKRALEVVARRAGEIIASNVIKTAAGTHINMHAIHSLLADYATAIVPYANEVAAIMLRAVNSSNEKYLRAQARAISSDLRHELANEPTGRAMHALQLRQVSYIQSIPLDAATRAQQYATEAMVSGARAEEVAYAIQQLDNAEDVALWKARLIARTEVARSNSILTQVRAESVGSQQYVWRTAEDEQVRDSHAEMADLLFDWADPPTLSDGTVTHPGQIYNCRCYPDPVLPGVGEDR